MTDHNHSDQDDPVQDFLDMQEHRYDPGYWTDQLYRKGRLDPYTKSIQRSGLSSFSRALFVIPFLGGIPVWILGQFRDRIHYWWGWSALSVMVIFLFLWNFFHRSMVKNFGRDVTEEIEHPTEHKHIR